MARRERDAVIVDLEVARGPNMPRRVLDVMYKAFVQYDYTGMVGRGAGVCSDYATEIDGFEIKVRVCPEVRHLYLRHYKDYPKIISSDLHIIGIKEIGLRFVDSIWCTIASDQGFYVFKVIE